jgi:hypothetical protein
MGEPIFQDVKATLPLLGLLVLLATACGGGTHSSAGSPFVVREVHVDAGAGSGQIYIYDPKTQADEEATEADNPLVRAMEDGYASRRFVGAFHGVIDLITPSQASRKVPIRIEVSHEPPPLDADNWDHIVELPLRAPSGKLFFVASGGGTPITATIPPGTYRARLSARGLVAGAGKNAGHDSYRLQLWPSRDKRRVLVKYWRGYDSVRPSG